MVLEKLDLLSVECISCNSILILLEPVMMKEMSSSSKEPFHSGLTKKIVLPNKDGGKRITNEAVQLTGELLRTFVRTLHQKAAIEAECEKESCIDETSSSDAVVIRPHHITKVAAEQLMDYS